MEINRKKVLVTGAGGFIGSHLIEALLQMNCTVKAFIHYNSFGRWGWLDYLPKSLINQLEIFCGDIRDANGVMKATQDVSVIFHLAALIGIPYSYHSPDVYVDTNIRGTLNILQAARRYEIEKIVHVSTSEVYGTAQFIPITEEHPINPQSPYAATKAGADFLALTFYRSFGTPVAIARPFNTYGPRQSSRAIIPTIITQILNNYMPIKLGSLTPTRDLNFVKDTVNGFIRIAESDRSTGEVINLGSDKEISIKELAQKISTLIGRETTIQSDNERNRPKQSEVERLRASFIKAQELLDWKPLYTLDQGLKETINWFNMPENINFYKPYLYSI